MAHARPAQPTSSACTSSGLHREVSKLVISSNKHLAAACASVSVGWAYTLKPAPCPSPVARALLATSCGRLCVAGRCRRPTDLAPAPKELPGWPLKPGCSTLPMQGEHAMNPVAAHAMPRAWSSPPRRTCAKLGGAKQSRGEYRLGGLIAALALAGLALVGADLCGRRRYSGPPRESVPHAGS